KIMLGLRCLMSNSCDVITMVGQTQYSGVDWVAFRGLRLTLRDDVKPQLVVAQPLSDGWHGAERTSVSFTATDNVGIAGFAAFVDGKRLADLDRHCYGASSNVLPAPCAETSAPWSAAVDLSQVAHGSHVLVISAVDPAGNIAERAFPLLVDHNAPATPRALRIASGTGWRSENRFDVAWANPADGDESPIAGADYELCPATNAPYDSSGCVGGQVRGEGLSELSALELPGDGAWRLSLSLRDAAGNADRDRAATLDGLRLDREPPAAAFAPLAPSDPTRVRLTASDAASGLAGVTVEARRRGEAEWRALSAQPEAGGYSAVVDDEQLPAGRYELRARVNDQAGNQRIVAALADGQPLELQLPLRGGTALSVGRSTRVRVKSARGKPRYHRVLVRKPHAGYGSAVALTGRVTNAAGNPRSQVPVEVLERVDLPGLEWRHLATVTTGSSGSFTFRALPGPARALRFRYPGTATTRPSVEEVELRVRAGVTLIPSRDYVRNGHSVVFRGRLLGRPIPREGKLLTLQALTSRGWRTFATPRAGGRDGRWTYRYHFTDTTSTVRYAFRVIAPKEAGYPYEEGISRVARVLVLGRG
ncbi:MAG TPA: carboxypeptidase-like regulatory domain-containing protein, partial [Conexibacter sp.]